MPVVSVSLRNLPGTEAAVGWAGGHGLIADRPEGKAGGLGLGFNGAQLLALAIGGCLCNDLRYIAHRRGLAIAGIAVQVHLTLEGDPPVATGAEMTVQCTTGDGSDPGALALIGEQVPPFVVVPPIKVTRDNLTESYKRIYRQDAPAEITSALSN